MHTTRRSNIGAVAIVIAACAVAVAGVGMTVHALRMGRHSEPNVRTPAPVLQPDATATKPSVG